MQEAAADDVDDYDVTGWDAGELNARLLFYNE